jgi:hypothetical protein
MNVSKVNKLTAELCGFSVSFENKAFHDFENDKTYYFPWDIYDARCRAIIREALFEEERMSRSLAGNNRILSVLPKGKKIWINSGGVKTIEEAEIACIGAVMESL